MSILGFLKANLGMRYHVFGRVAAFPASISLPIPLEIEEKVLSAWPYSYAVGTAFWPAANTINFLYVPPSFRAPYVAVAGVVWNTFLSWENSTVNNEINKLRYSARRFILFFPPLCHYHFSSLQPNGRSLEQHLGERLIPRQNQTKGSKANYRP